MSPEICVLSSSPALGDELEEALNEDKTSVTSVAGAEAAVRRALCGCAAAILVDEDPPDTTAAELLRRLRSTERGRDCLVVMLSSRTSEIDRVIAFELGADDYIPKPIGARELGLRLNAVLRRHRDEKRREVQLRTGPFVIDPREERAICAGQTLRLTTIEFRLLEHLARHEGMVQDRSELLARVWRWCDEAPERTGGSRTVDTHVKRLREKLGSAAEFIETIRGVGYRLRVSQ
ncbi:MAG: response regulator transcription factor [Myxococcota bacterium]